MVTHAVMGCVDGMNRSEPWVHSRQPGALDVELLIVNHVVVALVLQTQLSN